VFHVKHEGWEILDGLGVGLAPSQIALIERYENLVIDRAIPRGMVAASDLARLRDRHVVDCLRAVPILPPAASSVCDLGSGAGLPGIPVAIARPDLSVTLVEVRRTRSSFLKDVIADLALKNVLVHDRRSETLRASMGVCLARAFGNPAKTWEHAGRLLSEDGVAIYWAGASFDPETDVPPGVCVELFESAALARSGPLVIMSRQ
jgi:16S rRNA (guanine(527)-N(7))-methyltransferase RsmG